MKPEDYLGFIEGTATVVEAMTHLRTGFVDAGWTAQGAEAATLQVFAMSAMARRAQ